MFVRVSLILPLTLIVTFVVGFAGTVEAHPTGTGKTIALLRPDDREIDLMVSVNARDLGDFLDLDRDGDGEASRSEMEAGSDAVERHFRDHTSARNGQVPCQVVEQRFVPTMTASPKTPEVAYMRVFRCEGALTEVTLENRVLLADVGGHRHIAKVQLGEEVFTTTFSRQYPTYRITVPGVVTDESRPIDEPSSSQELTDVLKRFAWEGVVHILGGLDHVLFVIALLVVARRLPDLLAVVTAFTIGHSVTLACAVLDVVTLSPDLVEPAIAASIVWVGIENIVRYKPDKDVTLRFIPAALFGLLHGFGFSYVLTDDLDLPAGQVAAGLVSFNVGVEAGQLAIVLAVWPVLAWWHKKSPESYRYPVWFVSGAVALLALYWFVTRSMASLVGP